MISLKRSFKPAKQLFQQTFDAWLSVHATRLAAALSYYSIFSLGPLFIIIIAIVGFVFGPEAAEGKILGQLGQIVGKEGAEAIQIMIKSANKPVSGLIATIVSAVTLFIGATGVIIQLKDSMNTLWGVRAKPGHSLKSFFRNYLTSLATIFGFGFLLMASLILSAILSGASHFIQAYAPFSEGLMHLIDAMFSLVMFSLLIGAMFKYLPDIMIEWRYVWVGAVGTAVMFMIGKSAVAYYMGKQSLDSIYGAAAFVVIVMVWVYYLALAFFFGAEFTRVYALTHGALLQPSEGMEFDEYNKINMSQHQPPQKALSSLS